MRRANIPPLIYDAVAPCIWCPTTAAFVERSFSLAGLIDAKKREKMNPAFRATAVAMFCNTDVEKRFISNRHNHFQSLLTNPAPQHA